MKGPGILPLHEVERAAIEEAMSITGSKTVAAKALGITRPTLYRKLASYAALPPRIKRDPAGDRIRALEAQVTMWKNRYDALSRLGRAAADYFDDTTHDPRLPSLTRRKYG